MKNPDELTRAIGQLRGELALLDLKGGAQAIKQLLNEADKLFKKVERLAFDEEDFLPHIGTILKNLIACKTSNYKKETVLEKCNFILPMLNRKLQRYIRDYDKYSLDKKITANFLRLNILEILPFEVAEFSSSADKDQQLAHICHAISSLYLDKKQSENDEGKKESINQAMFYAQVAHQLDGENSAHKNNFAITLECYALFLRDSHPSIALEFYVNCINFYNTHPFLKQQDPFVLICCYQGIGDICLKLSKFEFEEKYLEMAIANYEKIRMFSTESPRIEQKQKECIHMLVTALLSLGLHYEKNFNIFNNFIYKRIENIYLDAYHHSLQEMSLRKRGVAATRLGYFYDYHGAYYEACQYFKIAIEIMLSHLKEKNSNQNNSDSLEQLNSLNKQGSWRMAARQSKTIIRELITAGADLKGTTEILREMHEELESQQHKPRESYSFGNFYSNRRRSNSSDKMEVEVEIKVRVSNSFC